MTIPIEAEVELKAFELWWRDYANAGRHQYHKLLHPDGIAKRIAKDAWDETNARTLPPTADEAFLRKLKSTLNDVNQTDKYSEKMLCVAEARAMVNSRLETLESSPVSSVVGEAEKVVNFVASTRTLFAHHVNVEEGNYLECLVCHGESIQHGRDLTPRDVTHADGCVVALANRLASIKPEVASDEEKGQQWAPL